MKKLIILIGFMLFIGCTIRAPEKPFIITYKFPDAANCGEGWCKYSYTDAKGTVRGFCDNELKYSIGDTIH